MIKPNKKQSTTDCSRRNFMLKSSLFMGSGAILLSSLKQQVIAAPKILEVPIWSKSIGNPVLHHSYGLPSNFEHQVIRRKSNPDDAPVEYVPSLDQASRSFTPLADLRGVITPNGLFFERYHGGYPNIDPQKHKLIIHGLVKRNLEITVERLKRYPSINKIYFLECSGNSYSNWGENEGSSVQGIHGLVSCAQWTGVPLSLLFREAGIDLDKAKYVIAEGADAPSMARSIAITRALDDVFVAYAQNGEALRAEQGYPLRLIVPGCEGSINIKWLRRLEVTDTPLFSRNETSKYTDLLGNDMARNASLIMEAKSVIIAPSGGQILPEKGFYEIRGFAWSGRGSITAVDVSTDGGKNWQRANISSDIFPKAITEFTFPWQFTGEKAILISRAIDETGYVQPYTQQLLKSRGHNYGYHNNSMQAWEIETNGRVQNVII
ncbi:sulfite dehydrogenase [Shewanella surugensis]|uniref:Sulfite dehydrogenase n=1 Tax=Shewanella surugensis TaxID=212020 RepID=A0ABT0LFH8_9GAMM|nr:sulfite dehydrogenase [Shewanella surugensis]MCL1126453.1 sulfite dehydrogenase [Shewanella surugensis]